MIYTASGQSPMSSLRDDRVRVPRLNALKFLQWGGAKMAKEAVKPMLDEGQPEEKLQEPYFYGEW